MSIKKYVAIKQLFWFSVPAILSIIFFSSCQKVTSSTTDIGDWAVAPEYSGATRTQAVSFVINNIAYVGTGYNSINDTRLTDFYAFDETRGSWYQVASLPGTARNMGVGFAINGKGYIATGYTDAHTCLNDVWEFDPNAGAATSFGHLGAWTQKNNFPGSARYGAVGFAINGKGYLISGFDSSSTYKKDLWEYDPTSDSWWQGADLGNNKRENAVAFVYNNIGYVLTGTNNGNYAGDLWAYNPVDSSWAQKRDINGTSDSSFDDAYGNNIIRSDAAIFLINDTAYLSCGSYNGAIGTTWAYDITNDLWFQKTSFEGPVREGCVGFSVNNHGYLGLGHNGTTCYDDMWQFFPDAAQTNNDNNP